MKPRLSVVVPCYNESLNLPELVARIDNVFNQKQIYGELVLVNDGSFDNTGHVIEKLAQEYTTVVPVHHDCNKGIADAWRSGVSLAKGTYVCLIDADLQYLPEDIWRLYREITNTSFDMVQGYRSSVGREKDSRYYISRGLNGILNVLFEMHLTDNKSGFVIARKETLEDVLRHRYRYHYFQTFITVSATVRGYSIREIETLFENRRVGQSFMSAFPLLVIMRVFADLVKAFF